MIIAVDFDGTCCVHNYPEIGEENPYAIQTMKSLIENGHKIFLWTMRGHAKDIIDDAKKGLINEKYLDFSPCGIELPSSVTKLNSSTSFLATKLSNKNLYLVIAGIPNQ